MEELKLSSTSINNLLGEYIELHNEFIKNTGSIFSIFKKIDYERLSYDCYALYEKLIDERNSIEKNKIEVESAKEKHFANILFEYSKALTITVYLLFVLLHDLSEKAKGEKLSISDHMENNKKYKESIDDYLILGEELNRAYLAL